METKTYLVCLEITLPKDTASPAVWEANSGGGMWNSWEDLSSGARNVGVNARSSTVRFRKCVEVTNETL